MRHRRLRRLQPLCHWAEWHRCSPSQIEEVLYRAEAQVHHPRLDLDSRGYHPRQELRRQSLRVEHLWARRRGVELRLD